MLDIVGALCVNNKSVPDTASREDRIAGAATWCLCALIFVYFYRSWLLTGFNGVFGDSGDARIVIAILEHWYRWFGASTAGWADPNYFYPQTGGLGLTDAYFLYALPYAIFRMIGLDVFNAFMGVMFVLSVIGVSTFYVLARVSLSASIPSAVIGATLFAFANMMALKMGHAQSYCAMLLPSVVLLLVSASRQRHWTRVFGLAAASGLLFGLIFLTAFLTGWFAGLIAGFTALVFILLGGKSRIRVAWQTIFFTQRRIVIGFFAGFLAGLTPFLALYIPVLGEGRVRSFNASLYYAPQFADIINVGSANVVWGSLLTFLRIADQPDRRLGEVELGYSPIVFLIVLATTLALLFQRRQKASRAADMTLALGLSLVGFWLLQLDYAGIRPWFLIWKFVPGAVGVRTTFRSQLVLNFLCCLLLVQTLDWLRAQVTSQRTASLGTIILAALLIGEQINRRSPPRFWRSDQLAWLADLPKIPQGCQAFYLAPQTISDKQWWDYQSDAMILAAVTGVPTINGNSSWWPADWALDDPTRDTYSQAVRNWITEKHLTSGLCSIDLQQKRWAIDLHR